MRTIITTVGTSLLQNAKRDLGVEAPNADQLRAYLRQTDPVKASAETNSLNRMLAEGDRIILGGTFPSSRPTMTSSDGFPRIIGQRRRRIIAFEVCPPRSASF